jgi:hypothetical protein
MDSLEKMVYTDGGYYKIGFKSGQMHGDGVYVNNMGQQSKVKFNMGNEEITYLNFNKWFFSDY